MSLESLMTDLVVIVHPAETVDRRGDSIKDWDNAIRTEVDAWCPELTADEDNERREAGVTYRLLYLPAGTDIERVDRVEFDADTYEVEGIPNHAHRPGRGVHHIQVRIKGVKG